MAGKTAVEPRSPLMEKARGARRKPVAEHLNFRIVKRVYHAPPWSESWHEYLAFEGDRLVGRVSSFEVPPGSRECWLNDLWVEQKHRRKGLGRQLLKITLDNARAHGYERVLGELTPYDNTPMETVERFYREHGFEIVDNWEETGKKVAALLR